MPHDWILDVLDDLRGFARQNGLQLLAEELKAVSEVALLELANLSASPVPLPLDASARGPDKG